MLLYLSNELALAPSGNNRVDTDLYGTTSSYVIFHLWRSRIPNVSVISESECLLLGFITRGSHMRLIAILSAILSHMLASLDPTSETHGSYSLSP